MNTYKSLNKQTFSKGNYSIVPIRMEDRFFIMKWRNEQMYHLRQKEYLTTENQNKYFETHVKTLFDKEQPAQILFSYLEGNKCIGYGGLVHINWNDHHSELSFIMDTQLENNFFEFHWKSFLVLIEQVAFKTLDLNKLSTYAFDLRPYIYKIFEDAGYCKEAVLRDHILINEKYINIVIHSKFNDYE